MHKLPDLEYEYNSLEPYIDEQTMKIHHGKHHQAYVDKLNKALEDHEKLQEMELKDLIANLNNLSADVRTAVRNNGGGVLNHSFFWTLLKKDVALSGEIKDAIVKDFGSYEDFKKEFSEKAGTLFGSGWVWLVVNNGKLEIVQSPNQDNPLTNGMTPILALDVWEHAYYLKYQNKRPDYIEAFFNVINWDEVNKLYEGAK